MKSGIHPKYQSITVTCACGNTFAAGSTLKENLRVEVCAKCHPLYTGKSNLIDTAGRIDKFQARQQEAAKRQEALKVKNADKATTPEVVAE